MTRLSELSRREDYLQLPIIEKHDLRFLWYSDFWDGPKSGLLIYRGKKHWFQICDGK
jgi:hypothetical protein